MKKVLLALFAAAVLYTPLPVYAQNDGYYARAVEQRNAARQKKEQPSLYGDNTKGMDFSEAVDDGENFVDDDNSTSFGNMVGGEDDTAGIHGYLQGEQDSSKPTNRRTQAANDAKKRRDAMIQKMKANSDQLLKKQKERSWKLAHPGQEYPDSDDGGDSYGYDDSTSSDDNGGWSSGGGDWGDGSGDDNSADWGSGGDTF